MISANSSRQVSLSKFVSVSTLSWGYFPLMSLCKLNAPVPLITTTLPYLSIRVRNILYSQIVPVFFCTAGNKVLLFSPLFEGGTPFAVPLTITFSRCHYISTAGVGGGSTFEFIFDCTQFRQ